MRNFFILILCSASLSLYSQSSRSVTNVPITHVFLPMGFDSNDEVDVVVEGVLPTLCHSSPRVIVEEQRGHSLVVLAKADLIKGNCPKTFAPFVSTLKIKGLKPGNYQLLFKKPSYSVPGLSFWIKPVRLSISVPTKYVQDENIYANVQSTYLVDEKTIAIHGVHPSNCFKLDRIEKKLVKNNVLVVLPKMTIDKSIDCYPPKHIPFEYRFSIEEVSFDRKTLIHIRSLSGQSLNLILNF